MAWRHISSTGVLHVSSTAGRCKATSKSSYISLIRTHARTSSAAPLHASSAAGRCTPPAKAAKRRRCDRYRLGAGSTSVASRRDRRSHLWRRPWCEITASSTHEGSCMCACVLGVGCCTTKSVFVCVCARVVCARVTQRQGKNMRLCMEAWMDNIAMLSMNKSV
eukprot:1161625-Pelagomonas_calceolata.AAC.23